MSHVGLLRAGLAAWLLASRPAARIASISVFSIAAALVMAASAAVARDIEKIESVGAAPIDREARSPTTARDRAVREALQDAVRRSASALVPIIDELDVERLRVALGDDPYVFATRFRVVEDRGVQPALFSSDPNVDSEYRVIVEVHIDRDLIRERLVNSGMLTLPSGSRIAVHTRISLEGVDDYRVYESIRNALVAEVGARSAIPIEAEQGRIVIEVDSSLNGFELLAALERAVPPHVTLIPLQVDPEQLQLRVSVRRPDGPNRAGDMDPQPPGDF